MKQLLSRWDQLGFYLALALYGVLSLVRQSVSMASTPPWLAGPIYCLFILSSIFLLVGVLTNRRNTFTLGAVFGIVGCVGVACAVNAFMPNAGALLVIALALALVWRVRELHRNNVVLQETRDALRDESRQ